MAMSSYTCPCGKICKSSGGLAAHRMRMHNLRNPAFWYACSYGTCLCCGMVFSSRAILLAHLTRGSKLCLLNIVMTNDPFSPVEEDDHRDIARHCSIANRKGDISLTNADFPAVRMAWVCRKLCDLDGHHVPLSDYRHPWSLGPGRLHYGWRE